MKQRRQSPEPGQHLVLVGQDALLSAETGQSMPISGSFQITPRSAALS